jgi:hypothetical protein
MKKQGAILSLIVFLFLEVVIIFFIDPAASRPILPEFINRINWYHEKVTVHSSRRCFMLLCSNTLRQFII